MAIYVDELADRGWRLGQSCHMATDDHSEEGILALKALARLIGLKDSYFQDRPQFPHFDLTKSRRALAVRHGAIEVDRRAMITLCKAKREVTE